jgi:hypothetical protein
MPRFDTPEPISVTIDLVVGDTHISASDRDDTVVEIRPSDPSQETDVRAAEQTRVEYSAGRLLVKAPKPRNLGLFGKPGSIDVTIGLPAGSHVTSDASVGALQCVGRLGECRVKTSAGDIKLDHTGPIDLNTSAGAVVVDHAAGPAEVSTGTGRVRLRAVEGTVLIKNSNGDCWVGEAAGDLRVRTANGDIAVDDAHAGVTANTSMGEVRIGAIRRGETSLKTAFGAIEVGIRAGTAAHVDLHTQFGTVHNQLDPADSPEPSDETVQVQARTSYGDIVIRRC